MAVDVISAMWTISPVQSQYKDAHMSRHLYRST